MFGQVFAPIPNKTIEVPAADGKDCCLKCAAMFNVTAAQKAKLYSDSILNGYKNSFPRFVDCLLP